MGNRVKQLLLKTEVSLGALFIRPDATLKQK